MCNNVNELDDSSFSTFVLHLEEVEIENAEIYDILI